MLNTIFYILLNMSLMATIIGIIVIAIRSIKRIPRYGIYIIWSIVFIRLIIPAFLSSEISIFNITKGLVKRVIALQKPVSSGTLLTITNSIGAAKEYFPITYKTDNLKQLFTGFSFIWLAVLVMLIVLLTVIYYFSLKELKGAKSVQGNLYILSNITSPLVAGIFKARVFIPEKLLKENNILKYVILHERVHIKRQDNLVRIIVILIACIHWFNPFVWLFLRLFLEDMEITCDISAVRGLNNKERKTYLNTLVGIGSGNKLFLNNSFSGSNIRKRVLNLVNYKKLTSFNMIIASIILIVLFVILLTNPII